MSNEKTTDGQAPEQKATPTLPMKLDVTARLIEPKGNLVGFASLKINDSFVINDSKILQSDKGNFVGMPSKPDRNSKIGYRDTARPITKEFRAELIKAVTAAYHAEVEKLQATPPFQLRKNPLSKNSLPTGRNRQRRTMPPGLLVKRSVKLKTQSGDFGPTWPEVAHLPKEDADV